MHENFFESLSLLLQSNPQGMHPGMRAMGEMRKQASETRGSGRGGGGIMSMIMPVYAVGIVIYMGYTLYKVCFYLQLTDMCKFFQIFSRYRLLNMI